MQKRILNRKLVLIGLLLCCGNAILQAQTKPLKPNEKDIYKGVTQYYKKQSLADGSGVYEIERIVIYRVWADTIPNQWLASVKIFGNFENPSLPDFDNSKKEISEAHYFLFKPKPNNEWECYPVD